MEHVPADIFLRLTEASGAHGFIWDAERLPPRPILNYYNIFSFSRRQHEQHHYLLPYLLKLLPTREVLLALDTETRLFDTRNVGTR